MRRARLGLLALTLLLAVLFVGGIVFAGEGKARQTGEKSTAKPAGKADDQATDESADNADEEKTDETAEKPAAKPAPKPAAKPAAKKTDADKAKADELEAQKNLTPLGTRLKELQAALEAATKTARGRMPADMNALAPYLLNKAKDLINPETEKQMGANSNMWNKNELTIEKPKTFITFYADQPTPDKGRAVIYADGTVKYLTEQEFKKGLEASKPMQLTPEDLRDLKEVRRESGGRQGKGG